MNDAQRWQKEFILLQEESDKRINDYALKIEKLVTRVIALEARLAEAERELAEAKDELSLIRYLVASSGIEIAETDKTGYIVSVLTSVLKGTDELWKAANKREREWATKWQEARAEADSLRAQLAERHTLADGYAGAMRELAEANNRWLELVNLCVPAIDGLIVLGVPGLPLDKWNETKRQLGIIEAELQSEAPRPDSEAKS